MDDAQAPGSSPDAVRRAVLLPPLLTDALPGIGGRLRVRADDFVVDEVPAYPPDGKPGWLLVQIGKRAMTTEDVARTLARALDVPLGDVAFAGRKDRDAVTRQWFSVPQRVRARLAALELPGIEIGPTFDHSHKLRTGHLRGNQFIIVIRELACSVDDAIERAGDKLMALNDCGGMPNIFGPQRFGDGGMGIERGLQAMRLGHGGSRGNMTIAAGQATLFNLYVARRAELGLLRRAMVGDILKKTDTGGLFTCTDANADDERLARGELVITGPIFGSRTMAPPPGTPSAELERDVLAGVGVDADALERLGRAAVGTRRPIFVAIGEATVEPQPGDDHALRVAFFLPAGAFATTLCREIQGPQSEPGSDPSA